MDALIGYTGFVGSNLAQQHKFDEVYNTQNIKEIWGKTFDLLVCAGAPGKKWWANQNRQEDLENLKQLMNDIRCCVAHKVVLISTVDVFHLPIGQDENSKPDAGDGYGWNRAWFEGTFTDWFNNVTIVRLPALFGPGLRKNVLFDLMNNNRLEYINGGDSLQWYNIRDLWMDIKESLGYSLLHLVNEPLKTSEIIKEAFPQLRDKIHSFFPYQCYDVHTFYSGFADYLNPKERILQEIKDFVNESQITAVSHIQPN